MRLFPILFCSPLIAQAPPASKMKHMPPRSSRSWPLKACAVQNFKYFWRIFSLTTRGSARRAQMRSRVLRRRRADLHEWNLFSFASPRAEGG